MHLTFEKTKKQTFMKKILLLLFSLSLFSTSVVMADDDKTPPKENGEKDKKLIIYVARHITTGSPIKRNLPASPVYCVYNPLLSQVELEFWDDCGMVDVSVENWDTGDIYTLYTNSSLGYVTLSIPDIAGNYTLSIFLENGDIFEGDFVIESL